MIVCIEIELIICQSDGYSVVHRNEGVEIIWRSGRPVSAEVGEHVYVVTDDV